MLNIKLAWWNVLDWMRNHTPVMCIRCMGWMPKCKARYEKLTSGAIATLCPKCHKELYLPYSSGGDVQ